MWISAFIGIAVLPRFASADMGIELAISLMPFAILVLFFGGAVGALYFLIRAAR